MGNTMLKTAIWMALVLTILLSGSARAQGVSTTETATMGAEQDARNERAAYLYKGPLPGFEGRDRAEVFREQLAEIALVIAVDRDFAEAEKRLAVLRLRAASLPAFDGQGEILISATAKHAEVLLAQKAHSTAAATLEHLLVWRSEAELVGQTEWFELADEQWLAKEREWLADARLKGLRGLVAGEMAHRDAVSQATEARAVPPGLMEEIWRDLQEGDGELVKAMGTAAVPALREMVIGSVDGWESQRVADREKDPLYWLLRVSQEDGLQVIEYVEQAIEQAELAGQAASVRPLLWRKRILREMRERRFGVPVSRTQSGIGWKPAHNADRWNHVLDSLVRDPYLWEDAWGQMLARAERGDWTPAQAAVVRSMLLGGHTERFARKNPWGRFYRQDSSTVRWVEIEGTRQIAILAEGLASPDPGVRKHAARVLRELGAPFPFIGHLEGSDHEVRAAFARASNRYDHREFSSDETAAWIAALGTLVDDEDAAIRLDVVATLGSKVMRSALPAEMLMPFTTDESRDVRMALFQRFEEEKEDYVPLDDAELQLVRALLADSDEEVRLKALRAAWHGKGPLPLDREELLRLSRDESKMIRGLIGRAPIAPLALRVELLTILAADSTMSVVRAAELTVEDLLLDGKLNTRDCLPYFEARLHNAEHPALHGSRDILGTARQFLENPEGLAMATHLARTHPDSGAIRTVLQFFRHRQNTSSEDSALVLADFPAADLRYLLVSAGEPGIYEFLGKPQNRSGYMLRPVVEHLLAIDSPNLDEAMTSIAVDLEAPRTVRIYAHAWCMRHRAARSADALLDFLREPLWDEVTLEEGDFKRSIRSLSRWIDASERNAVVLRVLQDDDIPELMTVILYDEYLPAAEGGVELSRAALARWLTLDTTYCRAGESLRHIGGVEGEVSPELLRHALRTNVGSIALTVLARLKDPQYLPDLRECLNPTWIGYKVSRHAFAKEAAFAISQYMTDEASAVLLDGLRIAENEEVRQACFDALERIQLYQDARKRLDSRHLGAEKREEAVRELSVMLGDKDATVVAAAARGLAAMGAVDELPALIRLMKHADASVRAAAIEAVERLTAPEPERQGATETPR